MLRDTRRVFYKGSKRFPAICKQTQRNININVSVCVWMLTQHLSALPRSTGCACPTLLSLEDRVHFLSPLPVCAGSPQRS